MGIPGHHWLWVYSQVIKGAQYMNIAAELEKHAGEELQHAMIIAKQIDYLGGRPKAMPKPVKTSEKAEDMLRVDLQDENDTIRNYRLRVRQCEALGEYALAEHIRDVLVQEQSNRVGDGPRRGDSQSHEAGLAITSKTRAGVFGGSENPIFSKGESNETARNDGGRRCGHCRVPCSVRNPGECPTAR